MSQEKFRPDLDIVRSVIGEHSLRAAESTDWIRAEFPGYQVSVTSGSGSLEIADQHAQPLGQGQKVQIPDGDFRLLADIDGLSYLVEEIIVGNWRDDTSQGYRLPGNEEVHYD